MFSLPSSLASHVSPFLIERLGWVLLHSLWQFALLAALAVCCARLLSRRSAETRYAVLLIGMCLMIVAPVVTWLVLSHDVSSGAVATNINGQHAAPDLPPESGSIDRQPLIATAAPGSSSHASENSSEIDRRSETRLPAASQRVYLSILAGYLRPWLTMIVAAWCLGVVGFSLRPLLSWYTVTRLRRVGVSVAPEDVRSLLERTARRLPLRRSVEVLQSTLVNVPVVVGYVRPVILLPISLVTGLPARQLEAILAHELAHIRRHDYLVNIAQTAIETLFFYHPGVWWLSSQIRIERENCCDDQAVVALGSRVEYGRALLAIEELRGTATALALGAGGGTLLDRVRRVLGLPVARPHFRGNPVAAVLVLTAVLLTGSLALSPFDGPTAAAEDLPFIEGAAWPQWGGSSQRNHVSSARDLPTTWSLPSGENVKWTAQLGPATYGSPVVARGKVLVGTNNGAGRIARFPASQDVSCLQCFDETTGAFLWQFSSEKLPSGRQHDWPGIGLCSTPCIVDDRVWLTTNRGEVVCLDLQGFRDEQNDGPIMNEPHTGLDEADIIWRFDMIKELGVSPQFQCCSSVTVVGDLVLLNTAHGPANPQAPVAQADTPSFLALDRHTGHVVWADASPGVNILGRECPSSSPAVGGIGDVMQAVFAGGDGWLYAFDLAGIKRGRTDLLWKFDGNPKSSRYLPGGNGTRNSIIASPVIHDRRVYLAMGQNPEHGEGPGHLWCIDATRRGDISLELVYNKANPDRPIPHKRLQACEPDEGDFTRPNPNSGVVWHYESFDLNGDGDLEFEETLHRACGSVSIWDGLAIIADFSGLVHCLDARTGRLHWTHDMLASVWGTPVIADGRVYICDEDGEVEVLRWSPQKELLAINACESSIYSTPAIVNGTIHLASNQQLCALALTEPVPTAAEPPDNPTSKSPPTDLAAHDADKPANHAATGPADDDSWPPRDPAQLLERLRQRDAQFHNRSLQVERNWVARIDPRAVIADEQRARASKNLPAVALPPDDEIPSPYDQPHRVPYRLTTDSANVVALDNADDLETMKDPRYETPVEAKRWLLGPLAWNRVMMDGRVRMQQEWHGIRQSFEWCRGYGFASSIVSIDSMRMDDDRLKITGTSSVFLVHPGEVAPPAPTLQPPIDSHFAIELDRDLIVRRATISLALKSDQYERFLPGASRIKRIVVKTGGTLHPADAPPVAAEGRYLVIVADPGQPESVLHDETITFVSLSPPLTQADLDQRAAADRDPFSPPSTGE